MKASRTRRFQTSKTNHMSDDAFSDLKQALEDALAFERAEVWHERQWDNSLSEFLYRGGRLPILEPSLATTGEFIRRG